MGYRYSAKNKKKSQLLNFLMGEAKMAVYISRRNKVEGEEVCEIVPIFKNRVKARVWVDFKFYKMMKDLMFFKLSGAIMMQSVPLWTTLYFFLSVIRVSVIYL